MSLLITHFFEGGTADEYEAVLRAAHPGGALPDGQLYHVAGPAEGGWLIAAVWDSEASFDKFVHDTLMPALQTTPGVFAGPPLQRSAEVTNLVTA
jgi:hypothetical protein